MTRFILTFKMCNMNKSTQPNYDIIDNIDLHSLEAHSTHQHTRQIICIVLVTLSATLLTTQLLLLMCVV